MVSTCKYQHFLAHCLTEQTRIAKPCLSLARHVTHCIYQHWQMTTLSDEGSDQKPTDPYLGSLNKPDGGICNPMRCESHYNCMMASIRPLDEKIVVERDHFITEKSEKVTFVTVGFGLAHQMDCTQQARCRHDNTMNDHRTNVTTPPLLPSNVRPQKKSWVNGHSG